jgi:hypothetical protein
MGEILRDKEKEEMHRQWQQLDEQRDTSKILVGVVIVMNLFKP